jgi:hypothetical protein
LGFIIEDEVCRNSDSFGGFLFRMSVLLDYFCGDYAERAFFGLRGFSVLGFWTSLNVRVWPVLIQERSQHQAKPSQEQHRGAQQHEDQPGASDGAEVLQLLLQPLVLVLQLLVIVQSAVQHAVNSLNVPQGIEIGLAVNLDHVESSAPPSQYGERSVAQSRQRYYCSREPVLERVRSAGRPILGCMPRGSALDWMAKKRRTLKGRADFTPEQPLSPEQLADMRRRFARPSTSSLQHAYAEALERCRLGRDGRPP